MGEGGRTHLLIKWDEKSRQAFILGANPGAFGTPFTVEFPWSVGKVEGLDWNVPEFVESKDAVINDRKVSYTAPVDDGFILRVTPLYPPER